MSRSVRLSRRTVLRGIGATIALPALEAMLPIRKAASAATVSTQPSINRMLFILVPNGKIMEDWTPKAEGKGFELPYLLEPLQKVRDEINVLSGLGHANALALGDGPGDHARAAASFLTGKHPFKTGGKDIRAGISVDQLVAQHVGTKTRLPSLEIGCDKSRNSGDCDSGYSCAYNHNISWRTEHTPAPKETNPKLVFERLFSSRQDGMSEEAVKQARRRKSVLDLVSDDASRLRHNLGNGDQQKLDEYFTSIREVERRIDGLIFVKDSEATQPLPDAAKPEGIPREYAEHVRLMYDMLALAFQADATRVSTFMVADESSNRSYRFLEVPDGHHDLSHHGGDQAKIAALRKINHWHVGEFARFIEKLKVMREGEGSLLDHSMIVYGSDLADGNSHQHFSLPLILAGRGGGSIIPGRHIRFADRTPMSNLFVAMMQRMGMAANSFGDSTGPLPHLDDRG